MKLLISVVLISIMEAVSLCQVAAILVPGEKPVYILNVPIIRLHCLTFVRLSEMFYTFRVQSNVVL